MVGLPEKIFEIHAKICILSSLDASVMRFIHDNTLDYGTY